MWECLGKLLCDSFWGCDYLKVDWVLLIYGLVYFHFQTLKWFLTSYEKVEDLPRLDSFSRRNSWSADGCSSLEAKFWWLSLSILTQRHNSTAQTSGASWCQLLSDPTPPHPPAWILQVEVMTCRDRDSSQAVECIYCRGGWNLGLLAVGHALPPNIGLPLAFLLKTGSSPLLLFQTSNSLGSL